MSSTLEAENLTFRRLFASASMRSTLSVIAALALASDIPKNVAKFAMSYIVRTSIGFVAPELNSTQARPPRVARASALAFVKNQRRDVESLSASL